jgi:hypothetical protein
MHLFISSLIIIGISCFATFSQQSALTNKDVIEMVKAGLHDNIILAKIKNSQCGYDTSSQGLIELKNASVSNEITLAILDCGKSAPETSEGVKK